MNNTEKEILAAETKLKLVDLRKKFEGKQVFFKKTLVNTDFKSIVDEFTVVKVLEFDVDYVYMEYSHEYCFFGQIIFEGLDDAWNVSSNNMNFLEFKNYIDGTFVEVLEMYRFFCSQNK